MDGLDRHPPSVDRLAVRGHISPLVTPVWPLLVVLGWNLGRFWERRDDEPVLALAALVVAVVLVVWTWREVRPRVRSGPGSGPVPSE